MNTVKYFLLLLAVIPCLPFLIWEGKKVRRTIPKLPEPTDVSGLVDRFMQRKTLLSIGESTVAGVGVKSHEYGLTGQLAKQLSAQKKVTIEWHVFAKSGLTAATLNQKILTEKIEIEADLILVGLGGNDAFNFTSPRKWNKKILGLIGTLSNQFKGVPILFSNMPPTGYFPAFSPLLRFFLGNLTELHRKELEALTNAF